MADRAEQQHRSGKPQSNYTMIQFFEWYLPEDGKHWTKFSNESERLASMGITAAWLPPVYKGGGASDVGYGTYDLWDLGEFDQKGTRRTKYGTKEELVNGIKTAKEHGIITYIDAVLNHKMGADEKETFLATMVDQNDREKDVGEMHTITAWSKFTFPGRDDKYSSMKWNFNHFSGCDYDAATETKAIFRIQGDGKAWARGVDKENANFDYLMGMDLDVKHPEVREELFKWGEWVLKETGASGFRFDAVKHIDVGFIRDFVKHVRETSKSDNIFCCGEYWNDSLETTSNYLTNIGVQFTVFDAPLHYNFKEAGDAKSAYDLRKIWDGTVVQSRPVDAVTLVDNHDTQVGQALQSWVSSGFKPLAYAMILLRTAGYPCIFYGDLYGCGGKNPQEPVTQLEDFIRARKLFAYGDTRDYWDHPNCVGWVRTGGVENHPDGCAVVLCNGSEGVKRMEVGKEHAGEAWTDVLGWHTGEITIGEDGWAEFRCSAESVSIWAHKDAQGRDEFSEAQQQQQ